MTFVTAFGVAEFETVPWYKIRTKTGGVSFHEHYYKKGMTNLSFRSPEPSSPDIIDPYSEIEPHRMVEGNFRASLIILAHHN